MSKLEKDENYIIDLVDEVLGVEGSRQHRFAFLLGDTGRTLPVDAFYQDLGWVIEYHERQHTESVSIMNRRMTVSGVTRGEQRRIYDQRRREVLPDQGIRLVVLDYSLFACNGRKRLTRADRAADIAVVRKALGIDLPGMPVGTRDPVTGVVTWIPGKEPKPREQGDY
ncbi:hypothetical protein [Rhodoblastus sp.]|jgi:hypothetical protein|uniref:hypothetical protein n=1 Tax=Rhodoblastus sp. TaxID=1962975 RepID=UPI0025F6EC8D|nr:hypothetical protein [Rhodoblastus sp.]